MAVLADMAGAGLVLIRKVPCCPGRSDIGNRKKKKKERNERH